MDGLADKLKKLDN